MGLCAGRQIEGSMYVTMEDSWIRCMAEPMPIAACGSQVLTTPVSKDMLGRIFNGSGKPIDGG
jgi:vacuolar-type H+-ATPase subunit B/Vma2